MVATQWLFNFVVAQAVPHMCVHPSSSTIPHLSIYHEANTSTRLATVGNAGYGTYFVRLSLFISIVSKSKLTPTQIFGSFCFSMFFFVWFLIPETKGMSLERMDDLFGVTEIAKAMADEEVGHGGPTAGPLGKLVPQVQESTADAIEHDKKVDETRPENEHMEEVKL
jgi:hypothetical protein